MIPIYTQMLLILKSLKSSFLNFNKVWEFWVKEGVDFAIWDLSLL